MALEAMHAVLYERLGTEGAREAQKAIWQALWNEATKQHPGEPLPCPVCFTLTSEQNRVVALENRGGMARGRCEVCRTEYRWADSDA